MVFSSDSPPPSATMRTSSPARSRGGRTTSTSLYASATWALSRLPDRLHRLRLAVSFRLGTRTCLTGGPPGANHRGMTNALLVIDVQESFRQRPLWATLNNPALIDNVRRLVEA